MLQKSKVSSKLQDTKPYLVKICWTINGYPIEWNEMCIWAIEMFGLTGVVYETSFGTDSINFHFRDLADAVLFELRWG